MKKTFIPYFLAGFPSAKWMPRLLLAAAKAGAGAIELGVPFSDPVADGPVLQKANHLALQQKITLPQVLEIASEVSKKISIPILLMGYTNPFFQRGWKSLAKEAQEAGIQGMIIADLPLEEAQHVTSILKEFNLSFNPFCSPTTDEKRMKAIDALSTGFVYLVAVKGVTGARDTLPSELKPFLQRARKIIKKPLYVGFGLSTPQQAGIISKESDGVILGSRIAEFLEEHQANSNLDEQLEAYLLPWSQAIQCSK